MRQEPLNLVVVRRVPLVVGVGEQGSEAPLLADPETRSGQRKLLRDNQSTTKLTRRFWDQRGASAIGSKGNVFGLLSLR